MGNDDTLTSEAKPAAPAPQPSLMDAIRASTLTPAQRMVLVAILHDAQGNEATVSVGELALRTGLVRSSITRNIKALRAQQWLRVEPRKGPDGGKLCNTYVVTPTPPKPAKTPVKKKANAEGSGRSA